MHKMHNANILIKNLKKWRKEKLTNCGGMKRNQDHWQVSITLGQPLWIFFVSM